MHIQQKFCTFQFSILLQVAFTDIIKARIFVQFACLFSFMDGFLIVCLFVCFSDKGKGDVVKVPDNSLPTA